MPLEAIPVHTFHSPVVNNTKHFPSLQCEQHQRCLMYGSYIFMVTELNGMYSSHEGSFCIM